MIIQVYCVISVNFNTDYVRTHVLRPFQWDSYTVNIKDLGKVIYSHDEKRSSVTIVTLACSI
jgi:hypothetical protein